MLSLTKFSISFYLGILRASLEVLYTADMTMYNDSSFSDVNDHADSILSPNVHIHSHSSSNPDEAFYNSNHTRSKTHPTTSREVSGVDGADSITILSSNSIAFTEPSNIVGIDDSSCVNSVDFVFQRQAVNKQNLRKVRSAHG